MTTASDAPLDRHARAPGGRWAPTRPARTASAVALAAVVPAVALLALAAARLLGPGPAGLADAGVLTRWGLPVVRGLHDAAATMTLGLLALAVLVLPRTTAEDRDLLGPVQLAAVRLAARWAAAWAALAVGVLLLTYSDVVGVSLLRPTALDRVGTFVLDVEVGRLLAGAVVVVLAVHVGTRVARRVSGLVVVALVALGGLMPHAVGGHSAGAASHDAAVNTLIVHLAGATVWVGGLAGLVVLRTRLAADLAATVRRFSTLAGVCFAAVAVSGVAGAVVRVGHWPSPATAYGALLAAKVAVLVVLGALGWRHRSGVLPALERSPSGAAFARLATVELVVMAVALGLGVALGRTPVA